MEEFDSIIDFVDEVNDQARRLITGMKHVNGDELGLDIRAGRRLYVSDDCICVAKEADRTLQYYGGFEYVDSEYRIELGDFVIYMADDSRVQECIDHFNSNEADEQD